MIEKLNIIKIGDSDDKGNLYLNGRDRLLKEVFDKVNELIDYLNPKEIETQHNKECKGCGGVNCDCEKRGFGHSQFCKMEEENQDWESRFDKEMRDFPVNTIYLFFDKIDGGKEGGARLSKIKEFISKELQSCKEQTKKEIVEKIKNSRTIEEEKFGIGLREETARSQVLADILILLK